MTQSTLPSPKVTKSQRALLASAALRKDRLIVIPAGLTDVAAKRLTKTLLHLELVQEIAARGAMPVWRREGDRSWSLKLTRAGIGSCAGVEQSGAGDEPHRPLTPRADTKIARVIARLARTDGASLSDLTELTGWLPHTARAALTRLRHRGFQIVREHHSDRPALYRIATASGSGKSAARAL